MTEKLECELQSWENIYRLSREVSKKIAKGYDPDMIIGLTRGGWVPARNLCDFLGKKDLIGLKVEHWGVTATKDGEAKLKFPIDFDLSDKRVLVVDDLTDTGKSMQLAIKHLKTLNPKEIRTATIFHINGSEHKPDFYAKEIEWKWIIFPWNLTEDLCNLIEKMLDGDIEMHIDAVRGGLEEYYDISVDADTLKEIMEEMERRGMVKKTEERYIKIEDNK